MATLATLYGLQPAPVNRCRVLEIGCGEGGNIIPLAHSFPESSFLGVDLSRTAIEFGTATIHKLGLKNARLVAQDLMDFPADAGTFDYIIAHGILSWVPEDVRQQMLEICARHLASRGVAYISYNTMPGGYLRNYARDLMRFHTRHISDPAAKIREARNIIDFVLAAIPQATIEREMMKREMKPYEGKDWFFYHDLLADVNDPIYFLDFIDAAGKCAMQFISEATMHTSRTSHLPPHIREQLEHTTERLEREQYLDFISGRRFRQTILCRSGHDLDLAVTPERIERLLVASSAKPTKPIANLFAQEKVDFRGPHSMPFSCREPISKAIFMALAEVYPRVMRFSELRIEVAARLGKSESAITEADDAKMIGILVSSFMNDAVEFHVYQFSYCPIVSERPLASPVARHQAEIGPWITGLDLSPSNFEDSFLRELIVLLDGTRDLQRLIIDLAARVPQANVTAGNVHKALELLASKAILAG